VQGIKKAKGCQNCHRQWSSDKSSGKNKYRCLPLLKLENRRIAVERRCIHVENQMIICEVHSRTFLFYPTADNWNYFTVVGQTKNLAAASSRVHLQYIRWNTSTPCTILSAELLLSWNPNYDGDSSIFIDMWNVNVVYVCVYPLLGLTTSKKQIQCWQSMCKTKHLLMSVVV
jgi:hypothetical protein